MAESLDADAGKGLKALGLNCTLKKSPEESNTEALMRKVTGLLEDHGVETEIIRPVDYAIRFGVTSDEGDGDEWPRVLDKVKTADILLLGMSIWFGTARASARWSSSGSTGPTRNETRTGSTRSTTRSPASR